VEAARCLSATTPPCTHACPPTSTYPASRRSHGKSARFRPHIQVEFAGATCARVCPCRNCARGMRARRGHKPIAIGRLQRHAMDSISGKKQLSCRERRPRERKLAVVGAGQRACRVQELAKRGHSVTLFEKRDLAGVFDLRGIIGFREPRCDRTQYAGLRRSTTSREVAFSQTASRYSALASSLHTTGPLSRTNTATSFPADALARTVASFPEIESMA